MKKTLIICSILITAMSVSAQPFPKGLMVGDKAPDFSAMDQSGKSITLSKELKRGPVVLVFYRGQWCPYCNRALKHLQDSLNQITTKGATVLTITPERQENISKTIEKTKATFSILHDDGLKIMKSYDVAYKVDDKTIESYKKFGMNFTEMNGEKNGANLPVPAVYVINREGKIIYRYFDSDYKKRTTVKEIISHI